MDDNEFQLVLRSYRFHSGLLTGVEPRIHTDMAEIWQRFRDRINVTFGIGTNLTHDTGIKPINIVIKMTECNGQPVVKLSDSPGKVVSTNQQYLAWVREAFDTPEPVNTGPER